MKMSVEWGTRDRMGSRGLKSWQYVGRQKMGKAQKAISLNVVWQAVYERSRELYDK